jgi:hypothetical protein
MFTSDSARQTKPVPQVDTRILEVVAELCRQACAGPDLERIIIDWISVIVILVAGVVTGGFLRYPAACVPCVVIFMSSNRGGGGGLSLGTLVLVLFFLANV